jgi:NADPH:quinone reductase
MNEGQHMQAIAISAFGRPDRLTLMDLPVPPCGPGQIVINIQAAGVGMWDVKMRQGSVRYDLLQVQKGETLLITGAAGGTGTLAVQLAAHVGAHVIATASSRNHSYLQMLGATESGWSRLPSPP